MAAAVLGFGIVVLSLKVRGYRHVRQTVSEMGIFGFPHPLPNLFGESELLAYQAPLALALAWRLGTLDEVLGNKSSVLH